MMWYFFFCFRQKTAYEMRISDWSSDVCSADLVAVVGLFAVHLGPRVDLRFAGAAFFAFLLVGRLLGLSFLLVAAVLGAFRERLVALDQVEVAQDRKSVVEGKRVSACRYRGSPYHSKKKEQ